MATTNHTITAVTTTIPKREHLLARAVASVFDQTLQPHHHVIIAQNNFDLTIPRGTRISRARNLALEYLTTDYVAFLDDDNYWLPNHLEQASSLFGMADVIYSPTQPRSPDGGATVVQYNTYDLTAYPIEQALQIQRETNLIDTNALVSKSILDRLLEIRGHHFCEEWTGGYCGDHGTCRSEDQCFYLSLIEIGAVIGHCKQGSWVYDQGTRPVMEEATRSRQMLRRGSEMRTAREYSLLDWHDRAMLKKEGKL